MYQFANLTEAEKALEPYWPAHTNRPAYTTEHIQAFMDYLGSPQNTLPAIHVAGTSGKTSTAYYAAALLHAAGKKVGLLVSPHIEQLNERVQINLTPLPEKQFCQDLAIFLQMAEESGITLTYAEILYAFAYWQFARHKVDYMVIETGMGGLLDATNVITRSDKVCVITDVGLDHTNVLGNSLREVARHKAGIIHWHNAVFCHTQARLILEEIRKACRQRQADLHILDSLAPDDVIATLPPFQKRNFSLALAAACFVLQRNQEVILPPRLLRTVALTTHIPARMEVMRLGNKTLILDGAHNAQKLNALRKSLRAQFANQAVAVLAAFTKGRGRQLEDLLKELRPFADHMIATSPVSDVHQWYAPDEIVAAARAVALPVEAASDYRAAFRALLHCPEPVLVVTGSLYIHQYIRPLALAQQTYS